MPSPIINFWNVILESKKFKSNNDSYKESNNEDAGQEDGML